MKKLSDIGQWTLRVSALVVSIIQSDIIKSVQVRACIASQGVLAFEARWLAVLICSQVGMVVFFSAYDIVIECHTTSQVGKGNAN